MSGVFEVYVDKAGEYRFRLKNQQDKNVLSSEGYTRKASCMNGIESVIKNSADPKRFVMNETPSGKYRFNLTATNGQVIGVSQNYDSESSCQDGIKDVAASADGASVNELDKS